MVASHVAPRTGAPAAAGAREPEVEKHDVEDAWERWKVALVAQASVFVVLGLVATCVVCARRSVVDAGGGPYSIDAEISRCQARLRELELLRAKDVGEVRAPAPESASPGEGSPRRRAASSRPLGV